MGPAPSRMVWPPKVKSIEVIGEVKDTSGRKYPRDIGRSMKIGNHHYFIFGDSFCFDKKGGFRGVANNSAAWIGDIHKPTRSTYLCDGPLVPHFIPHTEEEEKYEAQHKKENWRIVTWAFGGFVEDEPAGCGKGHLYYEKCETHGGAITKSYGVRVCRVSQYDDHHLKVERTMPDERIFPEGPQFGNIACVADEGWVYCIGGMHKGLNAMARARHDSDLSNGSSYQYWCNGGKWQDSFKSQDELQSILPCLGQGQVLKMPGHGPEGKSWMLFCNEKWPTGKIIVGWADKITGPWSWNRLGDCPKHWDGTTMLYAMFPHPWAFDWNKGELCYTWSDNGQMGGAVFAGKITFEVEAPPKSEEDKKKEAEEEKKKKEEERRKRDEL